MATKLVGKNRKAYIAFGGEFIHGDGIVTTVAGQFYQCIEKGDVTGIPEDILVNSFFESPRTGTQLTLKTGDTLLKIDFERFCKTQADFSMSQGEVDVGDDCDPGATLPDGITTMTGTLNGFFRFNDETQEFDDITENCLNLFMPIVEDDGQGGYTRHPQSTEKVFLGICLNGDATAGQVENWMISPISITSYGASGGNSDGQTQEISWSKGVGEALFYKAAKVA